MRFRKSIKLGCGVRINISSSGIGYSIGTRGFRTSVSPRGKISTTVSVPKFGLSYRVGSKHKSTQRTSQHFTQNNTVDPTLGDTVSTVSADINNFQTAEYEDILKRLKKAISEQAIAAAFAIFSPFAYLFLVMYFSLPTAVFWILTAISIVIAVIISKKVAVDMDYEMDEETKANYDSYCAAWGLINKSQGKRQQIRSTHVNDSRYHSGASSVVSLKPIKISNKLPSFMKTNVYTYCITTDSEKLIVFPDKLLIIRGSKIGAINYDDIHISYEKQNITGGDVYGDSEVVGHTWKYVNRNGTPDKRFKNNRQMRICKCGQITLSSESGLNVIIILSNNKIIDELNTSL